MTMLKTKIGTAAAALLLSLGAVGSASAFSITAGNYKFTFDNYDSGSTGYGIGSPICASVAACDATAHTPAAGALGGSADTMGVFSIALIQNLSTAQTVFTKGVDGYITGVFGGLTDHYVDRVSVLGFDITRTKSVGGTWAMYKNAVDYDPTLGQTGAGVDLNTLTYPGISDTGVLFLGGVFGVGAIAGDFTTTYSSTFDSATIVGQGQGYLDITGGSAMGQFDLNGQVDNNGNLHDMALDATYRAVLPGDVLDGKWTVHSTGQIVGNAIPEPGALALVGLALLGAGAATRRRKV
jgi:hypothetical protein